MRARACVCVCVRAPLVNDWKQTLFCHTSFCPNTNRIYFGLSALVQRLAYTFLVRKSGTQALEFEFLILISPWFCLLDKTMFWNDLLLWRRDDGDGGLDSWSVGLRHKYSVVRLCQRTCALHLYLYCKFSACLPQFSHKIGMMKLETERRRKITSMRSVLLFAANGCWNFN